MHSTELPLRYRQATFGRPGEGIALPALQAVPVYPDLWDQCGVLGAMEKHADECISTHSFGGG
jgi:hypothetical protein